MQKKIIYVAGIIGVLLTGSIASAGYKQAAEPVHISAQATYKYAAGQMGSARASADGFNDLRCSLEMGASSKTIRCYALDSTGSSYMECTTGDANMAQAVSSIGPMSRIYFTVPKNADGTWSGSCSTIHVQNDSGNLMMVP